MHGVVVVVCTRPEYDGGTKWPEAARKVRNRMDATAPMCCRLISRLPRYVCRLLYCVVLSVSLRLYGVVCTNPPSTRTPYVSEHDAGARGGGGSRITTTPPLPGRCTPRVVLLGVEEDPPALRPRPGSSADGEASWQTWDQRLLEQVIYLTNIAGTRLCASGGAGELELGHGCSLGYARAGTSTSRRRKGRADDAMV